MKGIWDLKPDSEFSGAKAGAAEKWREDFRKRFSREGLKGMPDGTGDICAFYAEGAVSFVRVIARAGSWVNVDGDGYVFVDGQVIDEPYASLSAAGDVAYPCQVPENMLFVLCDNRDAARDSRYDDFGFVSEDAVIGRVIACFHPPF